MEAVIPELPDTITVGLIEQLFASVIVQVYVPAASPVAVAAFPPEGAHE